MRLVGTVMLAMLALPGIAEQDVGADLRRLREGQKKAENAAIDRAADADDTATLHQYKLEARFEKLEEALVRLQQERAEELAAAKTSRDELARLMRQGFLSVMVAVVLAVGRLGWTAVRARNRHSAVLGQAEADKEEVLAAVREGAQVSAAAFEAANHVGEKMTEVRKVREGLEDSASLLRKHDTWEREERAEELARAGVMIEKLAEVLQAIERADRAYQEEHGRSALSAGHKPEEKDAR